MFPATYFGPRYYAPRYFPEVGATPPFHPIAVFRLLAEVSNLFSLTATPGGTFPLQAERSDRWDLKGGE